MSVSSVEGENYTVTKKDGLVLLICDLRYRQEGTQAATGGFHSFNIRISKRPNGSTEGVVSKVSITR